MRVSLAFLVLGTLALLSHAQDPAEGVVTGRLVRETGEPGVGIGIRIRKVEYRAGRRTLVELPQRQNGETPRQVITDDRGNFRLFGLEGGEYYLTAAPVIPIRISLDPSQPLVRLDATQVNRDLLRTMHYPGVTSLHQAQSITVRPGEEVRLSDFRFRTSVSGARITGKAISDVPAVQEPPRPVLPPRQFESPEDYQKYMAGYAAAVRRTANEVILIPHDRNMLMEGNPFALQSFNFPFEDPDPDAFAVNNVPPGSYDLMLVDRVRKLQSEPVPLVVGRSDIGGVRAVMHKASIRGRVSVSGNSETLRSALRGVELKPAHRAYVLPEQLVDSGGDFVFPEISSGVYELGLVGLPEDACVVGLRYGEKALDAPEIFIEEGPHTVEVLLNSSCGIVEGNVKNFSVATAPAARVVLVPQGRRRDFAVFYKDAAPDTSGHFAFRGISPGAYKLFAWASIPESAYMNPEYLARFESLGRKVEVSGAATNGIELELITP